MKPFYLILTLIPALLIGRTVSAQISVDEVDAGEGHRLAGGVYGPGDVEGA